MASGGRIALEWPKACTYWKWPRVQAFLKRYALQPYVFDGCAYNLVSQAAATKGKPIRKSWCIASNCESFRRLCRSCTHNAHEHVRLQGADTRVSESYTDELVTSIHSAWLDECVTHDRGMVKSAVKHRVANSCVVGCVSRHARSEFGSARVRSRSLTSFNRMFDAQSYSERPCVCTSRIDGAGTHGCVSRQVKHDTLGLLGSPPAPQRIADVVNVTRVAPRRGVCEIPCTASQFHSCIIGDPFVHDCVHAVGMFDA